MTRFVADRRWGLALILAAAVVPYLNGLDGGFHYDDDHALVRNRHVRQLASIPAFFVDSSTFSAEPAMAMYRPLLLTTFAVNHAISGYDARTWHLTNLLIHALAAAGAWTLLRRLAGPAPALLGGLLFGLHPVQTQAVDYLSSRSEALSMALVLWALVGLVGRRRPWSPLLYAGALLTKSAAVALLPAAWLVLRLGPEGLGWREAARRLAPHAAVTAGYLGLISVEGFLPRSLGQDVRPWSTQVWTQVKGLVYYLQLTVLPGRLSVEHDFTVAAGPLAPAVAGSALAALSLLWLLSRQGPPGLRLGGLWFGAALAVPFAVPLNVLVSEHRLYLAIVGFALASASCLVRLRRGRWVVSAVLCALLAVLVVRQNRLWQNELTLWTWAVERAPNSFRAWSNLGLALHEAARTSPAEAAYRRALALNPGHARAWNNLGLLLEEDGRLPEARQAYGEAARRSTAFAGPLANLGRLALATGDLAAADSALSLALRRDPRDVDALVHRGRLWQERGAADSARVLFERALRLDPDSGAAANNLGLLLAADGRVDDGRRWLRRALAARPPVPEAEANLLLLDLQAEGAPPETAYRRVLDRFPERGDVALALARLHARGGDWEAAYQELAAAARRSTFVPGFAAALGAAALHSGRPEAALDPFRRAVAEAPGDVTAWNGLAAAAAAAGEREEALRATRRVLRLDPDNAVARTNLTRLGGGARGSEANPEKGGK